MKNFYDKELLGFYLWLPISDGKTEGEWRDSYTGVVIENYTLPWTGSGAHRQDRTQNCAFLVDGEKWGDGSCNDPDRACMCKHNASVYLELKGLCPYSEIERYYKPTSDLTDSRKLIYQGLAGTSITFDDEEKIWRLYKFDKNVTGKSDAEHRTFVLGKNNWTIEGDKGCNSDPGLKPLVSRHPTFLI